MNAVVETVSLQVDRDNLVNRLLPNSFTNRTTVLGELLQNARRAGASRIDVLWFEDEHKLIIEDDGKGVADFGKLLFLARSGWDPETTKIEKPFGAGFFSAIYAAKRIIVESGHKRLEIEPESFLKGEVQPVYQSEQDRTGTRVILEEFDLENLEERMTILVKGFPVPIWFNGKELPRPEALDQIQKIAVRDIGVGVAVIPGMNPEDGKRACNDLVLYLQGFRVYDGARYGRRATIVHLDSEQFTARMPDRDCLRDEAEALRRVEEAMKTCWREHLTAAKATLPPAEFIEAYLSAIHEWGLQDILNDVPLIPNEYCLIVGEYPTASTWQFETSHRRTPETLITMDNVEDLAVYREHTDNAHPVVAMYLWKTGGIMVEHTRLDPDHWVHKHLRDLSADDMQVVLEGDIRVARYSGDWLIADVVVCDRYRICCHAENKEIVLEHDAVCVRDENENWDEYAVDVPGYEKVNIVVPAGERSAQVVNQTQTFMDESDHHDEEAEKKECDNFYLFIQSVRGQDPAAVFAEYLSPIRYSPFTSLKGKTFRVSFDEEFNITVTEI